MHLKDKNNNNVNPDTTADNVEYSSGVSVKQKIQQIEGGGSAPSGEGQGVPYTNLFDADDIVSNKGVVYNTQGSIQGNTSYSCVFIPLEFGKYYSLKCDWQSKSLTPGGFNFALAKGNASSFSNLLVSDFSNDADWLDKDMTFTKDTNVYVGTSNFSPKTAFTFKAPSASDFSDNSLTIGIVINTRYGNVSVDDVLFFTQSLYPVEYAGIIKGKNVAFFGDSITAGTEGGFVGLVRSKLGLYLADNFGSSGADSGRLATIMLNNPFRQASEMMGYMDYSKYQAVVIQIGTNGGVPQSADIEKDIPDIGIYDISSYPYTYSASGKTVASATVNEPIEFFTKCFPNTYYGNVALCIEYVRYINPNCRIFLTTIPPDVKVENGTKSIVHSDDVREAVFALSAKMGVQVIDARANAGLSLTNVVYWNKSSDGDTKQHFNVKGNELWASYIAHELERQWYETNIE